MMRFEALSKSHNRAPLRIEELEKRLRNRSTESEESLAKRVATSAEELEYANQFDLVIVNDDLETAKIEAYNLVSDFTQ